MPGRLRTETQTAGETRQGSSQPFRPRRSLLSSDKILSAALTHRETCIRAIGYIERPIGAARIGPLEQRDQLNRLIASLGVVRMSVGVGPQETGIGAYDRGDGPRRRLGVRSCRANMLAAIVVLSALATGGRATVAKETAAREMTLRTLTDFTLADIHSQKWSLADAKDKKVVVVAFIGTECPLAKLYGPRLALLATEYQDKSVAFLAIDSNVQDSLAGLTAYARNSGITFPLARDAKNRVAAQFGATRTPGSLRARRGVASSAIRGGSTINTASALPARHRHTMNSKTRSTRCWRGTASRWPARSRSAA